MIQGKKVLDIGPDFERRLERAKENKAPNSPFYNMERKETKNYSNYQKTMEFLKRTKNVKRFLNKKK